MRYTVAQIDSILEEVSAFEVELAEDPTLTHLRGRYLQRSISKCRAYLNRVVYYVQQVSSQIRDLKREVRELELDIELKMADKLADDVLVRKQSSIEDRKALAITQLRNEHQQVATLQVRLLDLEESLKILKFKHADLVRTNADIKAQRQIVKDEKDFDPSGNSGGYGKPETEGEVSDGMPPAVSPQQVDPQDLLDPKKRPDDMPEPVDIGHANMIARYYSSSSSPTHPLPVPAKTEEEVPAKTDEDDEGPAVGGPSYNDLLD